MNSTHQQPGIAKPAPDREQACSWARAFLYRTATVITYVPRHVFTWRSLRRGIALLLVLGGLWLLAFPAVFPVTSDAVLNAHVAEVRAPIDGMAAALRHDAGQNIEAGEELVTIANPRASRLHLASLQTRCAELKAKQQRLQSELSHTTRTETIAQTAMKNYRKAMIDNLEASIQETMARKEMAVTEARVAEQQADTARKLKDRKAIADMEITTILGKEQVAKKNIDVEECNLNKLRALLEAARVDAYVQVTPYFQQRADELASHIPNLKIQLQETSELLAAVETELKQVQAHVEKTAKATLKAPIAGVVWARRVGLGQQVKENECLYEVADTSVVFVEALLHQRHLASVGPGCVASINLTGGRTLVGKVRAVRTPGPLDKEPSFAVRVRDEGLKQVRVLIDIDWSPEYPSLIGRHVRVLITSPEPSWFDSAVMWLFSRVRV